MPATLSPIVAWNDVSYTSGGSTMSAQTLTTAYATHLEVRVTNGGTGPTAVVTLRIEYSHDNSNWYALTADMPTDDTASAVTTIPWDIPAVPYFRVVAAGGGTNAVTLRAEYTMLTG